MFKRFSSGAGGHAWPLAKIVAALKAQYEFVKTLGEDGPIKIYGVEDNGVNFVVAVVQTGPGSGSVLELGFMARFVGFPVTVEAVERLNRNLHIAVASIEGADLFLMAGLQVSGAFDGSQFSQVMQAWRRDLTMTLHGIGNQNASMIDAFPAARLEAARRFATNAAPANGADGDPADLFSQFLGAKAAATEICAECDGRGKRGLIARLCVTCGGAGFVTVRR